MISKPPSNLHFMFILITLYHVIVSISAFRIANKWSIPSLCRLRTIPSMSSSHSDANDNKTHLNLPDQTFFKRHDDTIKIIPDVRNLSQQKNSETWLTFENDQTKTVATENKQSRAFERVLTFPCEFSIKVIGENQPSFVPDIVALVANTLSTTVDKIDYTIKDSSPSKSASAISDPNQKSKYVSVTIRTEYRNADALYKVYEIPKLDKRIKYML